MTQRHHASAAASNGGAGDGKIDAIADGHRVRDMQFSEPEFARDAALPDLAGVVVGAYAVPASGAFYDSSSHFLNVPFVG